MHEKVLRIDLCIRFIFGKDNLADIFTKPLTAPSFLHQQCKLLVDSSPCHLRGDVEDAKFEKSEKGLNSVKSEKA